jgi:pimeloyl-ACP methyl ester carboxylesterase
LRANVRAKPSSRDGLLQSKCNAYEEGLKAFWDPIKAYWADGVADVSRIDPDNWGRDQALLDRPGNKDIEFDLFRDYGTNVLLYPKFQAFFRDRKLPTLIVWGQNDKVLPADGARSCLRNLPNAELHRLDTGHFALEDKLDVMAPLIHDFLDRNGGQH